MKTITFSLSSIFLLILFMSISIASGYAQHLSVNGYIVDSKTGGKIEAANVVELNSGIGTITDENGYFKLLLEKGPVELKVTDIKYKTANNGFVLRSDTVLYIGLEQKKDIKEYQTARTNDRQVALNDEVSEKKKRK